MILDRCSVVVESAQTQTQTHHAHAQYYIHIQSQSTTQEARDDMIYNNDDEAAMRSRRMVAVLDAHVLDELADRHALVRALGAALQPLVNVDTTHVDRNVVLALGAKVAPEPAALVSVLAVRN